MKIYCAECGQKAEIAKRKIPGKIDISTGDPLIRDCVICHNCKKGWDLSEPNNPYINQKIVAGNKFIDVIAILSLLFSALIVLEVGAIAYIIPIFWLIFYGIWYEKAKKNILLDESKLKQSLTAIAVLFFLPIGFIIIF